MYKYLIWLMMFAAVSACVADERSKVERIIQTVRDFRDAEENYKRVYGQYGSVRQLVEKGLLNKNFADGKEHGYQFKLVVEDERYSLTVFPETKSDAEEQLSLFVDESRVIRASVYPQVPAHSQSPSIAEQ